MRTRHMRRRRAAPAVCVLALLSALAAAGSAPVAAQECWGCTPDGTHPACPLVQGEFHVHYDYSLPPDLANWKDGTFHESHWHPSMRCGVCWQQHNNCDVFGQQLASVLDVGLGRSEVASQIVNVDLVLETFVARHASAVALDSQQSVLSLRACESAKQAIVALAAGELARVARLWSDMVHADD